MDSAKLNRWAELLLDTGKRNKLISFQDTKASTVEVVAPASAALFNKIGGSTSFEIYDPKLTDDENDVIGNVGEEGLTGKSCEMTRDEYIAAYSPKMRKASQVLLYSTSLAPLTALKNIDKKAKSAIEETGVNVAYIAFGFIHWKESENSNTFFRAPVLLTPVAFKNESAVSPYFMEMTGDEIVVNPTFSYKLNSEYGISLPEYNDEGLETYLENVLQLIKSLGWYITQECKIGIFSFLKLNMYQDIICNSDRILKNPNIKMLLGENGTEHTNIGEMSDEGGAGGNELIDLHTVVDADSSQIEAIEMAKSGKSFVLQGPPGTGKSQTITNVIAECLHDGKKVLFVSEKQAALNVVYDKLKQAGLEEFCLELHSQKANKKTVIDELCSTLRKARSVVSSRAEAEVDAKAKAQKQLDDYVKELHSPLPKINKSLYQLYEAYSATRKAPDVVLALRGIEVLDENYLERVCDLLEQTTEYAPTIGYDYRKNAWHGFVGRDTSLQTRYDISKNLKEAEAGLNALLAESKKLNSDFRIDCGTLYYSKLLQSLLSMLSVLAVSDFVTPAFFEESNCRLIKDTLAELQESANIIKPILEELNSTFEPEVFDLDAKTINKKLTKLYSGAFSRLFNADYKAIIDELRFVKKSAGTISYKDAVAYTEKLVQYHAEAERFASNEAKISGSLGCGYKGIDTDWENIIPQTELVLTSLEAGIPTGILGDLSTQAYESAKPRMGSIAEKMLQGINDCAAPIEYISALFDPQLFDVQQLNIEKLLHRVMYCKDQIDNLDNWVRFRDVIDKLDELGALQYLNAAISGNISADKIASAFRRLFYRQWIEHIINNKPILANFTRISQDRAVKLFSEKDKIQFEISKAQIKAELSAKRPTLDFAAAGSAVSVLLREGEKKRRQKPIRVLFEETGELVQLLKPCFLMSPLSVSTYLTGDSISFDTVVFDEASQIFPQDAIGAIYRGNQVIIVGDSKQMPPSNFFNVSADVEDYDEDVGDIADFESILDICSTAFPQRRLSWHYRSRMEQLIAFSNMNFYDNSLITFPSSQTDGEGLGVDYYYVDGLFDRKSHTNRAEAEFVVDLIFSNFEKYPERSLGVVAFSVAQQDMIERILAKRRRDDTSKEEYFSSTVKEPFFVKNLETVQGDERDTIIFSVAYGKDSQGRLLHNFGPLNRSGGERRLNVAVSRAKCNVQVISSMHYTDIDLTRTQSEGVRLLRDYLDFAENGMMALERSVRANTFEQFDSPFETEVYDFLSANGFAVDTQVGCSGYKIDIALKRPDSSDYVLAIECDGASYHSSRNARDRDRLRQSILESMGWQFYRIWSTDWFKNNRIEKENLLAACRNAMNKRTADVSATNFQKEDANENESEDFEEERRVRMKFPEYKRGADPSVYDRNLQRAIFDMLQTEAPLSEEWLLKRIAYYFGREKVTSAVWADYEQRMRGCENLGIIRRNGFLYLKGKNPYMMRVPGDFKRDIKYISLEELAGGIYAIADQNVTASKDGVYSTLCSQLGFSRCGDSIKARLNEALKLLGRNINVNGDILSVNK